MEFHKCKEQIQHYKERIIHLEKGARGSEVNCKGLTDLFALQVRESSVNIRASPGQSSPSCSPAAQRGRHMLPSAQSPATPFIELPELQSCKRDFIRINESSSFLQRAVDLELLRIEGELGLSTAAG